MLTLYIVKQCPAHGIASSHYGEADLQHALSYRWNTYGVKLFFALAPQRSRVRLPPGKATLKISRSRERKKAVRMTIRIGKNSYPSRYPSCCGPNGVCRGLASRICLPATSHCQAAPRHMICRHSIEAPSKADRKSALTALQTLESCTLCPGTPLMGLAQSPAYPYRAPHLAPSTRRLCEMLTFPC